jgi:hypothetical protein
MNTNATLWISGVARVVPLLSFAVSTNVTIRIARIQRAQIKTELLSRIVDLRLEYARSDETGDAGSCTQLTLFKLTHYRINGAGCQCISAQVRQRHGQR